MMGPLLRLGPWSAGGLLVGIGVATWLRGGGLDAGGVQVVVLLGVALGTVLGGLVAYFRGS